MVDSYDDKFLPYRQSHVMKMSESLHYTDVLKDDASNARVLVCVRKEENNLTSARQCLECGWTR